MEIPHSPTSSAHPHVLVIPYPAQGHMIALLDLTYLLATRGLSLTVAVTPANLPILDSLLHRSTAEALSVQTLVLPFPTSPTLPPGVENAQHLAFPYYPHLIQALSSLWEPIELWFRAHPSPPVAIISDFFAGWTQHLARSLGIHRITFYSTSALLVSAFHSVWTHLPQRPPDRSSDDSFPIQLTDVPGSPTLPWIHLPQIYRKYQVSEPVSEFLLDSFVANESSWGRVINSFRGLEAPYLDHLGRDGARVWAVGPMLPDAGQVSGRGGKSSVAPEMVLEWLDSKPDRSVVYVCFGSQAVLSNLQMERLGSGLESSGVDFLWCVKEATTQALPEEYGQVPAGLEERVQERGLIVRGWVPQLLLLKHRSIGAFLTHCGWNSTLEGLASGVPLLAWPMGADQYLNARLIVDQIGVGVRVCEGGQAIPDPAALAQAVVKLVRGPNEERARAAEMKMHARQAVAEGGSSLADVEKLVKELRSLCSPAAADQQQG
ncbi:UDP-glycosyltransferase [Nymphaea thermarum]|nr:UDP-glycosyltransferase [Nymphaea thermarum]